MQRRLFISSLLAGASLDPERLLWKPKLISIPAPRIKQAYVRLVVTSGANKLISDNKFKLTSALFQEFFPGAINASLAAQMVLDHKIVTSFSPVCDRTAEISLIYE